MKRVTTFLFIIWVLFFINACYSGVKTVSDENIISKVRECTIYVEDEPNLFDPFEGLDVLERITFIQENTLTIIAALVRNNDRNPPYSIEIFFPELNEFQSLYIFNIPGWSWRHTPHSLRAIGLDGESGVYNLVLRTSSPKELVNLTENSWDTRFLWSASLSRFDGTPTRLSTEEYSNANGTTFSATIAIIDNNSTRIELYDSYFQNIQNINFQNFIDPMGGVSWLSVINFHDLNNDGFGDLWISTSALNEDIGARGLIYQGHIWNNYLQIFIKVEFIDFDWLMNPVYQNGYVRDYIRNFSTNQNFIRIFVWDNYRLVLISEELVDA